MSISPSLLRRVLPDIGFLIDRLLLLFSTLYQFSAFWPPKFLMRNLLIILLRISCMWWVNSLLLFLRFTFCLCLWQFNYVLVWVCLSSFYLEFVEVFACLYSCLSPNLLRYFFFKFGKFWAFIFSSNLSAPFCLFFLILLWCICWLVVSHRYLRLFPFLQFFFLLFLWTWSFQLSSLQVCWFFPLPAQICLWIPSEFLFQLLYFFVLEILFRSSSSSLIFPFRS